MCNRVENFAERSKMNKPFSLPFERRRCRLWRPTLANSALTAGALLLLSQAGQADSLWHNDSSRSMYADKKAAQVGDLVTILVQENSSATKDNSTKTSKQSSVDASIASFLYS